MSVPQQEGLGRHTARCEGLCTAPSLVFNTPFPIKSCHRANYAN